MHDLYNQSRKSHQSSCLVLGLELVLGLVLFRHMMLGQLDHYTYHISSYSLKDLERKYKLPIYYCW
ncbi:Uncharacterised protein [Segatella copri]|nr:Uncharacterised protein [Segatella copri]